MADQDFNIKVVTTADTTGIRQTSAELDALRRKAAAPDTATLAARQAALRGALTPVPVELQDAAAGAAKVEQELKKVEAASLFSGINLGRARQEATFLARELATGVPSTRTLSSLLGAMGPYIAGAVGAGFALNRAIVANAERQVKVNQELDVQLTKVTELSQKWNEMAKSATGPADLLKVADAIIPTLDQASEKLREFQNTSSVKEAWQSMLDTFTAGIPGVGKAFDVAFEKQANVLADNAYRLNVAAGAAVKRRLDEQRESHEDIDAVIDRETSHLTQQQALLRNLDPKTQLQSWVAVEQTVERITKKLEQLNAQRTKQVAAGEPTSKSQLLETQEQKLQKLLDSGRLTPAEREAVSQQITKTREEKFQKDIADREKAFQKDIADRDKRFTTPPVKGPPGESTTETNQRLIDTLQDEKQDPILKSVNDQLRSQGIKPITKAQEQSIELKSAIEDLGRKFDKLAEKWG